MKKILVISYIAIISCMIIATIIENGHGSEYASQYIYGSWWFSLLWAILAAAGCAWIVKQKMRRWSLLLLHASFIIILIGAAITHFTAKRGMIHLRIGEKTSEYIKSDGYHGMENIELPFTIGLDTFIVSYHEGTNAIADFTSKLTITDGNKKIEAAVSMNKIFTYRNYRLYQNSYDDDGGGSILTIKSDPIGIATTYAGYALLFFTLVFMLIDPKGTFRHLLRNTQIKKALLFVIIIIYSALFKPTTTNAAQTLPREQAARFGRLNILYNNRICPIQTFAIDFAKKIYGHKKYNNLTPEQVVTGLIFYGNEWNDEKFIHINKKAIRDRLNLPEYVSLNQLFANGKYTLGPYFQEYIQGNNDKFHQQVADLDEKLQLIMDLRRGTVLKIFPYFNEKSIAWYAPTEQKLPAEMDSTRQQFIKTSFNYLYQSVMEKDFANVDNLLLKIRKHQQINGGASLPTPLQRKAEFTYNAIPFAKILFMACLTMGLLSLIYIIYRLSRNYDTDNKNENTSSKSQKLSSHKFTSFVMIGIMVLSFAMLTWCETLRWIIGGTVPMANGYETMLLVAWFIMLISLISYRRFPIILTFGYLLSGFFLLVAHISNMDPQITHIMPVLSSPLLSIHVSIIMMSYALLGITFICSIVAIIIYILNRNKRQKAYEQIKALASLSRLFLYPSMTTLGLGIFIGAIWANISWGEYWSWDPKETWALITFMIYALPLHTTTLPHMKSPLVYHIFMIFAFLSLLMTYFGVNYLLGGMHSYA